MEKGNSSNSNSDVQNWRTATRDEYWPSFKHLPANTNDGEEGDYYGTCRMCYHTFKYNIYEEGHELSLKIHYQWHINGGEERDHRERLQEILRKPEPKNCDWYKDYYQEPKPFHHLENPRGHFLTRHEPTHYTVYEKIYEFRGDHTVSCTKCGQVLNYKEKILREHYDDHQSQAAHEERVRQLEHMRIMEEREKEAYREKNLREEKEKKKLEKQIEISLRKYKKREEERRIAATKMAEIEQQEADAAFWNEAAQMADNAGAGASQQQENEEEDQPWWDEILQYVDSQNL